MVGGVVRASSLIDVLPGMGCAVKLVRPDARDAEGSDLDGSLWSPADWVAHFHERAAILEHDEGLGRAAAEAEALQGCFVLWSGRRCW